ncbi:branched-chain amino acid ABC transporter permease [Rhodosalinus halophilus]|uniref:Branched-chain amino acid ABC transporter permease n=1 Tax=Rhodosalinus halophilus TaxID=2259333 RepID=A0A365U548_9RHOB|nr:branched-chain amino acid ABC transporter permease [Rhodosalinus halophilus]RBI83341.1 branched-chain amino acid ABC transporter permease [Rhodosalinus halophilus]
MRPTGIWFESYAAEARVLETLRARLWLLALLAALVLLPAVAGPWLLGEFTNLFITLVAVYGLYVTVGMAGQINIAQSAFVGVGAFTAAKLSGMGVPIWATIPAGALAAGCISIVFALPAWRVKGFYLALTTLAAQVMFPIVILALPMSWLGGLVGMPVMPPTLFGLNLGTPTGLYFLGLFVAALATWTAFNLPRSRIGRAFRAVHDNDSAASVMGIQVTRIKIEAFFAGALYAGVAGAVLAYFLQFVTVSSFTLFTSVWYLGMLIVGGLHSPVGPILGVVFVTLLQEGLHKFANAMLQADGGLGGGTVFALSSVVLALCILIALIFEPRGLAHLWHTGMKAFRLWPFPRN